VRRIINKETNEEGDLVGVITIQHATLVVVVTDSGDFKQWSLTNIKEKRDGSEGDVRGVRADGGAGRTGPAANSRTTRRSS